MTRTPLPRLRALPLLASLTLLLAAGCGGSDGTGTSVGGSDTTGGSDAGGGTLDSTETTGTDLCADVACPSTEAYCEDNWAYNVTSSTCDPETGACILAPGLPPDDCGAEDLLCVDGECVDACADVVCPPIEPSCLLDGVTLQTGGLPMCDPATGECGPVSGLPIDCSADGGTCEDGECVGGDPCVNVTCPRIAPYCDGDIVFDEQTAYCDPFSGECIDRPGMPPQDCSADGGTCVDGKCINDTCEPTESFYYLEDGLCQSCKCPESGVKSDATCATTSDTTLCGVADPCDDVACEPTDGTCDGDTAHAGAMTFCDADSGECVPGALSLPKNCTLTDEVCLDGACVAPEDALCTPGESYEAADGCNTCTCPDSGQKSEASCTEMACPDQCTEAACGPMPAMPNYLCEDGVTMAGPGDCEMQEDDTCGWTVVTCPEAETCTPGESFEAADGCNNCICPVSGLVSEAGCTKMACACGAAGDCAEGYFCDFFLDDCGAWGGGGTCTAKPETCVAGGPGACSCGGLSATNGCELQAAGEDVFEYGGCSLGEPDTFACGENTCSSTTEYCSIWINDVGGGPTYDSTCDPLPMGCGQGDCSCLPGEGWEVCLGASGHSMVFYPGG